MINMNRENLTPWMQQYYEIKENYKDSILFFRMWDFYEMFDKDAEIANKVLGIAITSRNKNSSTPIPLAWIPFHAKEKYLPLLVEAWYKVAIAEQVSDPKLKWIVKREVVRVVTPATIWLEWENYELKTQNSNIISITGGKSKYWLSILNLWENKWMTCEFNNFLELESELFKIFPKEVILEKTLISDEKLKEILEKKFMLNIYYYESKEDPYNRLKEHFNTMNLSAFGIENLKEAQKASSLLLEYLESTQKTNFKFLTSIWLFDTSKYLSLDEATIRNLDLVYNLATKSNRNWTLYWILNKTKTSSWAYMMQEAILKPLNDKAKIEERLDFIEALINDKILLDKIREELTKLSNINLILNRIAVNRASPRDLINLKNSLKWILRITEIIKNSNNKTLKQIIK